MNKNVKPAVRWAVPIAAAAVIAGSVGTVSAAAMTPPAPSAAVVAPAAVAPVAVAPAAGGNGSGAFVGMKVTPKKAAKTARAAHAKSKVIEISEDRFRGASVWEVTVVSVNGRWEVSVDAQTGKVVRDKVDDVRKRARDLARVKQAKVRYGKAMNIALKAHPHSGLDSLELDVEHGRLVWEASLVTRAGLEYDLDIDAATGAILKNKLDR